MAGGDWQPGGAGRNSLWEMSLSVRGLCCTPGDKKGAGLVERRGKGPQGGQEPLSPAEPAQQEGAATAPQVPSWGQQASTPPPLSVSLKVWGREGDSAAASQCLSMWIPAAAGLFSLSTPGSVPPGHLLSGGTQTSRAGRSPVGLPGEGHVLQGWEEGRGEGDHATQRPTSPEEGRVGLRASRGCGIPGVFPLSAKVDWSLLEKCPRDSQPGWTRRGHRG